MGLCHLLVDSTSPEHRRGVKDPTAPTRPPTRYRAREGRGGGSWEGGGGRRHPPKRERRGEEQGGGAGSAALVLALAFAFPRRGLTDPKGRTLRSKV